MKKYLFTLFALSVAIVAVAQGHRGSVSDCAPMKNGKVCYTDTVRTPGISREMQFEAINAWAVENYGKDVFMSNVNANKARGTIMVSSKVELLLNDSTKTTLTYKMYITCGNNRYTVEARDITYHYDAKNNNRYRTYKAENVIANNGAGNTSPDIKDPVLFCNATFFFIENLFAEVSNSLSQFEVAP